MCLPNASATPISEAATVPRWKLTWGAIAFDVATGATGYAVGEPSQRRARRQALAQCNGKGGRDCEVMLAYQNQCAVIADPVRDGQFIPGESIYRSGPTIEETSNAALSSCSQRNGGTGCRIVYSACSEPLLVN
ncbi:DUF4189 domain-containing protein [Luteimonas huabeiensis]|uniref:DUF4189 domain-containing protein n=1 Tax=Luteimonas huabeiensis TaxID=1244513 RepID=UPI003CCDBE23